MWGLGLGMVRMEKWMKDSEVMMYWILERVVLMCVVC